MGSFFKQFLVIGLLSLALQFFMPWWSMAMVGFAVSYFMGRTGLASFFAGFLALFCVWSGYALWIDGQNDHILSAKIIQLFHLPNSIVLVLVTGLVAGLVTGFASLAGFGMKKVI